MSLIRRKLFTFWLCLIVLLLSTVCQAKKVANLRGVKAPSEKVLRIAYFSHDLSAVDPLGQTFDPDSYSVISQIFDSLLYQDLDGNLLPSLATTWRRETPTQWIFTLRKGVKFHNGEDFDAEAIKFSLETYLNPANHLYNGYILRKIKAINIINAYEIAIETHVGNLGLIKPEGPLADLKVRKALNHALDRAAMIKYADFGNAIPSVSLGKVGELGHNPNLQPYSYDPALARTLLAEAGHPLPIRLKLLASDGSESVAKIMKTNLKDVGINLQVNLTSTGDLIHQLQERSTKKKPFEYHLAMLLVDSPIYDMTFAVESFLWSKSPASVLNSPKFDEMIQHASEVADEKEHERKLQDLDRYIYDQSLLFFTTQRIITAAVRDRFNINKVAANGHLDSSITMDADVVEKN